MTPQENRHRLAVLRSTEIKNRTGRRSDTRCKRGHSRAPGQACKECERLRQKDKRDAIKAAREEATKKYVDRCPKGHLFNMKNTYFGKRGRKCRVCDRERHRVIRE